MASSDGRLLRWIPGPPTEPEGPNLAKPVENAPIGNRTFIVTAERHVMLFAMDGGSQQVRLVLAGGHRGLGLRLDR